MPVRHLPVLDGLRAVAVLLVLWCHVPLTAAGYPEWLRFAHTMIGPGGTGVELFFVLSGFLITRILIRERERRVPVRWFLLRRLLRIFPIYYLLLVVMFLVQPSEQIGWAACYLLNLRELFVPGTDGPLGHLWSLCIEEHFYLLWPLVVAFSPPGRPKWILLGGVLPMALLSAYLLCVHQPPERAMMAVQHASPVRFLSLGVGSLLAYGEPRLRAAPGRYAVLAGCLVLPAVALHPLVLFVVLPYQWGIPAPLSIQFTPMAWLVQSCLQATVILLLCLTASEARWSPLRLLTAAPLRAIGRISYGLYLYHLPIYHWLLLPEPTPGNAALAFCASVAAATGSYFVIERPILRYASRFR